MDEGKTAAQLCAERAKRLDDAIHMRQPDRVPIVMSFNNLLSDLEGITRQELYESPELVQVWVKATREFGQYERRLH